MTSIKSLALCSRNLATCWSLLLIHYDLLYHHYPHHRLNTDCLTVTKLNYLWISDDVSWSISSISFNYVLNPPCCWLRCKRVGYLNWQRLILDLTGSAYVRLDKITTPYWLRCTFGCTESISYEATCFLLAGWQVHSMDSENKPSYPIYNIMGMLMSKSILLLGNVNLIKKTKKNFKMLRWKKVQKYWCPTVLIIKVSAL